jgi:hypothetical protein
MRTISALFDSYDDAKVAVADLEDAGVPREDLSIVSSNADGRYEDDDDTAEGAAEGAAGGAGIGAVLGGAGGLLTGLGIMAIPGVGPVVAAGWLAATAVGAAAGAAAGGAAGGIIGALTDSGVPENDAHVYAEGVRRGGTLVTARVSDALAVEAERILTHPSAVDLNSRRRDYESDGWTGFDPDAPTYRDVTRPMP